MNWAVDGRGLRQVSGDDPADVDNYDPCYLPDGRIIFCSTRCFQGVPCVGGGDKVANLFIMDADGKNVRQLMLRPGPRLVSDGAQQRPRAVYPLGILRLAALLHAAAVHDESRRHEPGRLLQEQFLLAELDVLRPADPRPPDQGRGRHLRAPRRAADGRADRLRSGLGRFEADGAVQRIPGFGKKVEPIIRDGLVEDSWPKFLHPYPLSEKYFLVSCKPTPSAQLGHLPGRYVRQLRAPGGRAGLRHAGAGAAAQDGRRRR